MLCRKEKKTVSPYWKEESLGSTWLEEFFPFLSIPHGKSDWVKLVLELEGKRPWPAAQLRQKMNVVRNAICSTSHPKQSDNSANTSLGQAKHNPKYEVKNINFSNPY